LHVLLPKYTLRTLQEKLFLEWTYNSNAMEGNTLTSNETKVVLEELTVDGKTLREHLEVINHRDAIRYVMRRRGLYGNEKRSTNWLNYEAGLYHHPVHSGHWLAYLQSKNSKAKGFATLKQHIKAGNYKG